MARGHFPAALAHFAAIGDDNSAEAPAANRAAGDIQLLQFGRLLAAEQLFRRALKQNPNDAIANEHLAYLLGVSSRNWELIPFRLILIEQNRIEPLHLYLLSLSDAAMENDDMVSGYHQRAPDDPGPLLALSRIAFEAQDYRRAKELARQAIERAPTLAEAHAKLGRALLHSAEPGEFAAWRAELPREAMQQPAIWAVLGAWTQEHSANPAAIRCYWEAVKLDANHQEANYQLGRALTTLGRTEDARPFLERAELLQRYVNVVKLAVENHTSAGLVQAGDLAEKLGLVWEAYAWNYLASQQNGDHSQNADRCQQLRAQYFDRSRPTARNLAQVNPAFEIDLSDFPLFDQDEMDSNERHEAARTKPTLAAFREEASERGVAFRYFNGGDPSRDIHKMYEFTGGGSAAIDFDGDTWPDIYLTQGSAWSPSNDHTAHLDRLFRNQGTGFVDVTERAGISEISFSQGVAVGDFDNDGFPDVYVGNIGANRLFHNNGDGTFSPMTHAVGEHDARWTTSCVIADINRDGLPDIYDVNYLRGENVFTLECDGRGDCMPQAFPAEQDQLYINLGDGRFANVTSSAGIERDGGKGLGIVATDFEEDGAVDLFIANDSETNSYFRLTSTSESRQVQLVEEAMLRGVAMNSDGRAEACMGVAAGDANGDGRIDLYVTNFYQESNTLYLQEESGSFRDATLQAKLRDASMYVLGFGTQFIDADLDGWLDLFVANGHIDDLRADGQPFQMRPQFYQNDGTGQFVERQFVEQSGIGGYFDGEYLGRSVIKLDWNKDGREDLLVGHLDAPSALLTNVATTDNNYLAVHLRATSGARDAVGATVCLVTKGRTLVRQLTAGDGYQASNERRIVFGLGAATQIDTLTVRWPSGHLQTFPNVAINAELLLVEQRDEVTELLPVAK
jgi:tetratricopeptide (TPR) repeat protein